MGSAQWFQRGFVDVLRWFLFVGVERVTLPCVVKGNVVCRCLHCFVLGLVVAFVFLFVPILVDMEGGRCL